MAEQPTTERDRTDAPGMREGRRFPISRAGWVGIAAAILGLAYFLVPEETAKQASDRKPPPETRTEVPKPMENRLEVVGPTDREKSGKERTAEAKDDTTPKTDADRGENRRSEPPPAAAEAAPTTAKP
jgi:hypothetical protein